MDLNTAHQRDRGRTSSALPRLGARLRRVDPGIATNFALHGLAPETNAWNPSNEPIIPPPWPRRRVRSGETIPPRIELRKESCPASDRDSLSGTYVASSVVVDLSGNSSVVFAGSASETCCSSCSNLASREEASSRRPCLLRSLVRFFIINTVSGCWRPSRFSCPARACSYRASAS